ncbi:replication protein, repA [Mycobacteroides abscessus subsp. abscessus]|nr:replication protein, repA [Mycobacteroides abscessus subsp. abscessus]
MARNQCANRDFLTARSAQVSSARPTPFAAIAPTPHVVRALANERRRGWVERAGACAPRAPMWTSRNSWLDGLQRWAQSPALGQLCAEQRVSITAATLVSIAVVMAEHADHTTGRHVAVTRATIAHRVGCDVRTVTAAWRVLRASQWAVEAQRGHGSPGTPSVGRRPSVYHLVPRRDPRPARCRPVQEPVHDFHLPPSGGVGSFSPVGSYSPSGRASAPARQDPGKGFKTRAVCPPRRSTPRPLATQRLAAALVAGTHSLDRAHIGTICDALTAASIDPTVWTARAITDALNADMRARGVTWPDHITNPGAFLSHRLRRLNWSPPEPSTTKAGGCAAASIDHTPPPEPLTAASRARIAAAQQEIRRVLRERAHHRTTTHCHEYATAAPHIMPLSLTSTETQQQ